MAIDAFVQFTGDGASAAKIVGETKDQTMSKLSPTPFDIKEWSFGLTQSVNIGSGSGGAGAGKVAFDPFVIKKSIDTASPKFFHTLCVGGHYDNVALLVRKAGAAKDKSGGVYLEFDFKMAFITKIDWSHDDPAPTEEITFDYGALQVSYKPQLKTGGLDSAITVSWDKLTNSSNWAGSKPLLTSM